MKKDYSLLRPFDLEAAKRGEEICLSDGSQLWDYMAGPDANGFLCLSIKLTGAFANPFGCHESGFRMAPLCWVEGNPVYKGDVLYWKVQRTSPCVAEKIIDGGWLAYRVSDNEPWFGLVHPNGLTWTPPKVKREGWVNVYKDGDIYKSCLDAHGAAKSGRIACVRIEWEEPAGSEG